MILFFGDYTSRLYPPSNSSFPKYKLGVYHQVCQEPAQDNHGPLKYVNEHEAYNMT